MASTNKTKNLKLSKFASTDKPSWLADYNNDMEKIDKGASPTGSVMSFAGASIPEGWLLCNGAAVSRVDYAGLFKVIGITYGAGDGANTFVLPDLRSRFARGANNNLGTKVGSDTVTLTTGNMPSHSHTPAEASRFMSWVEKGSPNGIGIVGGDSIGLEWTTGTAGEGKPFSILPSSLALNYIIKY